MGELFQIRHDRLGFVMRLTRDFGDIVRFRVGFRVLHLVSHPDYVQYVLQDNQDNYRKGVGLLQAKRWLGEGLVTSEGEVWLRQRRLIQPAFQRQHLNSFASVVTTATSAMLERWQECARHGRKLEIASQMMRLTLEVITQVLFSTSFSNAGEIGAAFTLALQDTMDRMTGFIILPDWLPFPGKLRFRRALKTLNATADEIIRTHRDGGDAYKDLVSMLSLKNKKSEEGFADRELRDQIITMLIAGHETTASSLAWTFYLLSRHPWAWQRLRDEVDQVLGGRLPTHADLPRLVWTRTLFEESLRLYPPVWLIPRRAVNADEVGGYHIPAGSDVLISPYVLHRHPKYWEQPDIFLPERFSGGQPENRHRYIYLPFGAGPRICVATSFAVMEALLILTMVTQKYRLEFVPNFKVVPEPLLTLRFRNGLHMTAVSC
jgi:cytochrome P450